MTVDLEVKRAYVETLLFFVEQGRAPHFTELSTVLGVGVERALELQRSAAEAGIGELGRTGGFWRIEDEAMRDTAGGTDQAASRQ